SIFSLQMGNFFSYPDSRIVETSYGQVQGRRLVYSGEKQVDAFQGIPFAKPPIGELRFEKPHLPEKWSGIKQTKSFQKGAIQAPILYISHYLRGFPSEDCLYLNVFTPCWDPPVGGFPVMVFIHGGGFELGDTGTYGDLNICDNIVSRDVIFVTVAYRLGYLGFFTTGDDACFGNFGLWDQVAALKWVSENIEAFGGNKNNITLLGQSAGSISTDMLHLSPHSTGLFHKMICMAGTSDIRVVTDKDMLQQCREKVASLGITDYKDTKELLEKLRALPADKFEVYLKGFNKGFKEAERFETVPWIGGDFFPESLDELRKKSIPKPLMTGITKEEGILFLAGKKPSEESFADVIELAAGKCNDNEQLKEDLQSLYVSDEIRADKDKFMRSIANIMSDYYMNADAIELCRKTVSIQDEPVYLYILDYFNPKIMGIFSWFMPIQDACHGGELFYLFKKGIFSSNPSLTDDDRVVVDAFTTSFTNFAKYGNPNGPSKYELPAEWIPADKENWGRNFVFSPECHINEDFFNGRPAKYKEILVKHNVTASE
ncbi:hypothetical protein PMAYCL1PPCAC_15136, partial [Pristionchus mayeri]